MTESPAQARKQALRAASRAAASGGRSPAARAILERLLQLSELEGCRIVALYAAIEDEVPVEQALSPLRGRGVRTVFPRVEGAELAFFEVRCTQGLEPGYAGIREPARGLARVDPQHVDFFCIPGMLFDRRCCRLGRGGGHFDRLLATASPSAYRVGCSYADRIVESLPEESWDVPMHMVVTEQEVIRRESPGR